MPRSSISLSGFDKVLPNAVKRVCGAKARSFGTTKLHIHTIHSISLSLKTKNPLQSERITKMLSAPVAPSIMVLFTRPYTIAITTINAANHVLGRTEPSTCRYTRAIYTRAARRWHGPLTALPLPPTAPDGEASCGEVIAGVS